MHISPCADYRNLQEFSKDYAEFKDKVSDMELRLGAMVCQAFDECSNCESAFKVSAANA